MQVILKLMPLSLAAVPCLCSNGIISITKYQIRKTNLQLPTSNILKQLTKISLSECGAAYARKQDCSGFTMNKEKEICSLVSTDQIEDVVFSNQDGTNLYLLPTVECVKDQDCNGTTDMACLSGQCVVKCQPFQYLEEDGNCTTYWKFQSHRPFESSFLPWLSVNASYLHGFNFDPTCEPADNCSMLMTNQTIPNLLYEVWPLQGVEWPVEHGLVFYV